MIESTCAWRFNLLREDDEHGDLFSFIRQLDGIVAVSHDKPEVRLLKHHVDRDLTSIQLRELSTGSGILIKLIQPTGLEINPSP